MTDRHESVLLDEILENLQLSEGDRVIDATLGLGGHAKAMAEKVGTKGQLLGFDQDERNLNDAKKNLESVADRCLFFHTNFENIASSLEEAGIDSVDAALFDLGLSSPHFDEADRGFSIKKEGPLDMRMDPRQWLTAREVVNKYSEQKIADILYYLGEETYGRKIASVIVKARRKAPIETTTELADIIAKCKPQGKKRIHPATQSFQAIRMEVNREMEVLVKGITAAFDALKPGGRLAIISFHSLEDRKVKKLFKHFAGLKDRDDHPLAEHPEKRGELITKKPISPSEDEISKNPRSRSAKLRVIQKI